MWAIDLDCMLAVIYYPLHKLVIGSVIGLGKHPKMQPRCPTSSNEATQHARRHLPRLDAMEAVAMEQRELDMGGRIDKNQCRICLHTIDVADGEKPPGHFGIEPMCRGCELKFKRIANNTQAIGDKLKCKGVRLLKIHGQPTAYYPCLKYDGK